MRELAAGLSERAQVVVTVAAIGVLAITSVAWVYGTDVIKGDLIRSDAVGYYLYLPAILIDHDVTMKTTEERSFKPNPGEMSGTRLVPPHGYRLDQFPVGEAIMILPFFGVAHVVALVSGARTEGFSWPYQVATTAAGLAYMLAGLLLLAATLRRFFSQGTVIVTLLAITFGTNLFHYATINANFSHAFSFFLVALCVRLTIGVWEQPRPATAAALGASLGLVTIVRASNLVVLLFCALIGVDGRPALRRRGVALKRHAKLVALGAGAFALLLVPQIAYWHAITGKLYVYPYESGAHFEFLHPHLIGELFSVRKGLFFWTPLLLIAVAGLPLLRRVAPAVFIPAVAYLVVQIWVVSSWNFWWYGGSFGARPFVESLPILALGFAAVVEVTRSVRGRRALYAVIAVTTLLAVHGMLAYWTQRVPYDGTTFHQYVDSFVHL